MTPEETPTRTVRHTPDGFEVLLRPARGKIVARVIGQLIFVVAGWFGLKASRAALESWTATREIHGFFGFLDRQEWSERTIRWLLWAAIGLSAYFVVAGIFDILSRLTRRDRILMSRGEWHVRRSAFGIGRERVIIPRSVALELESFEMALTARGSDGTVTITNLGTDADRAWLKDQLDKQGTSTGLNLIAVGSSRVIATVRIDRRSDGSTFITNTKVARYGCAIILSLIVVGLLARGFSGSDGAPWIGFGLFFSIAAIILWLSSNDRDELTINRGSIRWRSYRFLQKAGAMAGSHEKTLRDSALYVSTVYDAKRNATHRINAIDDVVDVRLLTMIGTTGRGDAETVMSAIAEASGFPIIPEGQADYWRQQKWERDHPESTEA